MQTAAGRVVEVRSLAHGSSLTARHLLDLQHTVVVATGPIPVVETTTTISCLVLSVDATITHGREAGERTDLESYVGSVFGPHNSRVQRGGRKPAIGTLVPRALYSTQEWGL